MSAYSEAKALQESLPETGALSWEIGKVYNALLEAAKTKAPESISLAVLEPVSESHAGTHIANQNGDSMRAMLAVIVAALKPATSYSVA